MGGLDQAPRGCGVCGAGMSEEESVKAEGSSRSRWSREQLWSGVRVWACLPLEDALGTGGKALQLEAGSGTQREHMSANSPRKSGEQGSHVGTANTETSVPVITTELFSHENMLSFNKRKCSMLRNTCVLLYTRINNLQYILFYYCILSTS